MNVNVYDCNGDRTTTLLFSTIYAVAFASRLNRIDT